MQVAKRRICRNKRGVSRLDTAPLADIARRHLDRGLSVLIPASFVDQLDRLRLRRAALRYAAHGWPVTPGAWLSGHRFACGRPGCPIMTCHPALESWEDSASTDPGRVAEWWRRRPHSVLLATGWKFDALEVPAALGLRVLGAARLHGSLLGDGA